MTISCNIKFTDRYSISLGKLLALSSSDKDIHRRVVSTRVILIRDTSDKKIINNMFFFSDVFHRVFEFHVTLYAVKAYVKSVVAGCTTAK